MKKLIVLFTATVFGVNGFAQEPVVTGKEQSVPTQVHKAVKDGISFNAGKAWLIKDGQTTALDKEITLRNGTRVTPSGSLIFQDGTKAKLQEGDFVYMDGAVERTFPVKATDRAEAYPEKDARK
ncbi:MAG TPA: DUF6799 domain-containing protein [Bacteroidia bacterium]|nr:DUF6799 domain-containing protein [Bacteroidia bacterium]